MTRMTDDYERWNPEDMIAVLEPFEKQPFVLSRIVRYTQDEEDLPGLHTWDSDPEYDSLDELVNEYANGVLTRGAMLRYDIDDAATIELILHEPGRERGITGYLDWSVLHRNDVSSASREGLAERVDRTVEQGPDYFVPSAGFRDADVQLPLETLEEQGYDTVGEALAAAAQELIHDISRTHIYYFLEEEERLREAAQEKLEQAGAASDNAKHVRDALPEYQEF